MAKSRTEQMTERLHAAGLRKQVARTLAEAQKRVPGRAKPATGPQKAIADLRGLLGQVEDRITGGSGSSSAARSKRSAAAKKAAATRKKNVAKRSASAKKGAKTRKAASTGSRSRGKSRS